MLIIYLDFLRQLAPSNNLSFFVHTLTSRTEWGGLSVVFTASTNAVLTCPRSSPVFKNGFLMFVPIGFNAFNSTSTPASYPFCGQTAHMVQHRCSLVNPQPASLLFLTLLLCLPCLIKFWKIFFFRKVISFVSLHRWILVTIFMNPFGKDFMVLWWKFLVQFLFLFHFVTRAKKKKKTVRK